MDVRRDVLDHLQNRRPGFSLPQTFCTDPEVYRLDLETIFYRDWLFVGHDCEIPSPGNFLTLQVGAYPVIVLRGGDGLVRAFHNSCRHRGSRLCAVAHGITPKLVCPYHQWTYELDGRLLFARDMGPAFDAGSYGLKAIHCRSQAGYLFISLSAEAPDFESFRAQAEPYLAPHRLDDVKVAFESTIVENGNWKLVWENNRECYHCAGSHPELCRTFPETPTVTGVEGAMKDLQIAAHWDRCEAAGLPSMFQISDDGQHRVTRMPLLRDAVSYTMSGRAAVRKPLSDIGGSRIGALLLFHYPSTWNHVLSDHAISFRVLPVGPMETQLTTKWLVHKDAVEGVDYDLGELTRVWQATNDQDRRIVEENQIGVSSPAYEPGPYAPTHEGGVTQFVDWYCGFMAHRLGDGPTTIRRVA